MRTLIVGPAKSGTTALLYMLAQAFPEAQVLMEEPCSKLGDPPPDCIAKVIFENESEDALIDAGARFDRRILLVRDPRDNFLSRVLYRIANQPELLADHTFVEKFLTLLESKQARPSAHDLLSIAAMLGEPGSAITDRSIAQLTRYAQFVDRCQHDWQVVYYEDMIEGNLRALRRYLRMPSLSGTAPLPSAYAHIPRSKRSGDWRQWFTSADVAAMQPALTPLLASLGYAVDWALAPEPRIEAAHAANYVRNLIQSRRAFYALPLQAGAGAQEDPSQGRCTICGHNEFSRGPNGRTADNGAMPRCTACGALERQRIVRSLLQAMPLGFIDWRRGLQFSPDPGVCADQFRSYEVSVYGGDNSLDIQAIARADHSYDFISFNHVLEFVPDDLASFAELIRVLSPRGILQACFSTPMTRATSIDYSTPFGPHEAWHLYGLDLPERFHCAQLGLGVLAVEAVDPCTGIREVVHFFTRDPGDVARLRTWIGMSCPGARFVG